VGISRRLWTAGGAHDPYEVGIPPVIHFSTASVLHIYPVADQQFTEIIHRLIHRTLALAGPGLA